MIDESVVTTRRDQLWLLVFVGVFGPVTLYDELYRSSRSPDIRVVVAGLYGSVLWGLVGFSVCYFVATGLGVVA